MAKWRKRQDPGYDEFIKAVRTRDKNQCQMPGCKHKKSLQVHHIWPYSKYSQLRVDPSNGILLCKKHHSEITGKEQYFIKMFNTIISSKTIKLCEIDKCNNKVRSGKSKWCEKHYYRNRRNGSPETLLREQYNLNHDFFNDEWNDEKAWILGILWSDGWIYKNSIGIKSKDIELINNFKKTIKTDQIIKISKTNDKEYYYLLLTSKILCDKLRSYGIHENKSLTIEYPTKFPVEYFGSFFRGIIDGDGHISFAKQKNANSYRMAVSFVSGSKNFAEYIQILLNGFSIKSSLFTRTKFRKNGNIENNWKGNDIYTVTIADRNSLNILYELIYPNNNVPTLTRKKEIFDKWKVYIPNKSGRPKKK